MKKFVSILLVAMLILGMFPATALTAFAADTEVVFEFGANGSASHADGSSKTSYSETVNGYTLNITGGTSMYTGARDAKGNSCIKLGTSSKTGGFSFTAPEDVTSVVIYIAKYKANTTKITVNGTAYTLSGASNDGAYDAIEVDTSTTKTVTLTTVSGGVRAMVNSIAFVVSGGSTEPDEPDVPACEHTEQVAIAEAKDATCTEPGTTAGLKCASCGEVIEAQKEIPALGHNYVDGICDREGCGESLTLSESETYVFANFAAGTQYASDEVHKLTDLVTITTTECHFTSELRIYSSSTHNGYAVIDSQLPIEQIAMSAGNKIDILNVYGYNKTTAAWDLVGAISVSSTSYNDYTLAIPHEEISYTQLKLDVAGANQVRIKSLTVNFITGREETCECTNTAVGNPQKDPTCRETGWTATTVCADCGKVLDAGQEIPALGHTYEQNACIRCSAVHPNADKSIEKLTSTPIDGDVLVIYNPDSGYAMSTTPIETRLTPVLTAPVSGALPYINSLLLTVNTADGENFTIKNGEGAFLTTGESGNSLTFEETATEYSYWTIKIIAGYTDRFVITNKTAKYNESEQAIEYYSVYNNFTVYSKNTSDKAFQMQLYLVERSEQACLHPNAYETDDGYAAECGKEGKTNSWYCPDCETTTVPQQTIPALTHNYVDGECEHCGENDPLPGRYYIAAQHTGDNYLYMTNDLGTASTKRYQAVDSGSTELSAKIDEPEYGKVFVIVADGEGYKIMVEGAPTDACYLGWKKASDSAANNGILVAEEEALKVTALAGEGTYQFTFNTGTEDRFLSLNNSNAYFAWYKTGQKNKLSLIPVTGAEVSAPVVNAYVDGQWVSYSSVEEALTAGNGQLQLIGNIAEIAYEGNLTLDLNGFNATDVTATKIYAYDSSATSEAAGTGVLTTTSDVAFDYTANNKRYIALKDGNNYTFHVLDMKLSGVTLRTTAAGIYYKATVTCDSTLLGKITNYGVLLSTNEVPTEFDAKKNAWTNIATATTALESGKAFTSGSVFGIFKDGKDNNATRGTTPIYANAYIKVDGQTLMTGTYAEYSMYDVMTEVNQMDFTAMKLENEAKYNSLDAFYDKWESAMSTWNLDKLDAEFGNP